ncbi:MAG TPA: UDP-N-acetylenolpyruvoylglucosamine reductase, partial [Candidatus Brocadiaceae bacterium]
GSVFKKIEGVGAGRLIDQSGLKGARIGGAEVSTKHANFIVNTGNASAADVLRLIKHVQEEVKRKLGYELEPEITVIGEL